MQKARRRARYEAWHDGGTGTSSLNPFANHRTAPRQNYLDAAENGSGGGLGLPTTKEDESYPETDFARSHSETHVVRRDEPEVGFGEKSERPIQEYSAIDHVRPHAATMPVDNAAAERMDDQTSATEAHEDDAVPRKRRTGRLFHKKAEDAAQEGTEHHGKNPEQKFTIDSQLRAIFYNSWSHLLLLFIPAGFAVQYTHRNSVTVFCVNFVAMLPSIMVISFAIDEVGLRMGETLGGLVSSTFNNVAQLITSILLLRSRQIVVLQISLLGAILSNLLLMPGLSFFFGGMYRMEQHFNITFAQCISTMLLLAVLALMIPSAAQVLTKTDTKGIVQQSRGISVVLLLAYGCSLYYQLGTHAEVWNTPGAKVPKKRKEIKRGETTRGLAQMGAKSAAVSGGQIARSRMYQDDEDEDEAEEPQLSFLTAVGTLIMFTTLLTFNTLFATDSINGLLEHVGISKSFLGLVILPLLSNDPTTLIVAVKDKMDLTLALTLWKCVQIALLVIPFIVILGWIMDVDAMTLNFGSFEIVVLFASILVVNYIVQDGKSDWLVGALLVAVYVIIAIAAFFVP